MLEASVVAREEIPAVLVDRYGFEQVDVLGTIDEGSANLWRTKCDGRNCVLKEFQSSYQSGDVDREPAINDTLRDHGLPVVRFIPAQTGDLVWTFRNRVFHLQEHAEGHTYANNQAPEWLMLQSARMLGDIHETMPDLAYPLRWDADWYQPDLDRLDLQYQDLIGNASRLGTSDGDRITEDLAFRKGSLSELENLKLSQNLFTYRATHGDYHVGQFVVSADRINAIVDFSATCVLPVVWEIIRSFTLGDPGCDGGDIGPTNLSTYVNNYLDRAPLTESDVEHMLPLYYAQLLRSRYGYREYINGTEDPAGMLDFAYRRTTMCRWLQAHMAETTHQLLANVAR